MSAPSPAEPTWWRTHATMAWPHGRLLRITEQRVEIQEPDGTWNAVPVAAGPPAGAVAAAESDAER